MVHSFLTVCFLSWKVKLTLALLNCYSSLKLLIFLEFVPKSNYCTAAECAVEVGWMESIRAPVLSSGTIAVRHFFAVLRIK